MENHKIRSYCEINQYSYWCFPIQWNVDYNFITWLHCYFIPFIFHDSKDWSCRSFARNCLNTEIERNYFLMVWKANEVFSISIKPSKGRFRFIPKKLSRRCHSCSDFLGSKSGKKRGSGHLWHFIDSLFWG